MSESVFTTMVILILLEEYSWDYESEWAMMAAKSHLFLTTSGLDSAAIESLKSQILNFLG